MNILVTGGAGFIGSHFVLRHVQNFPADRVIVLDKLTYASNRAFLDAVKDRIRFIEGDIADARLTNSLVEEEQINVIINFAAETHVDRSISDAAPFLQTNILGVQNLIEVCRSHPSILLFHISTDEVYGDLKDDELPKTPADALRPSSPYAASKAAGDLLLLSASRTYGIRIRISRCTNNFGPHQADEKFIPTVIRSALAGKSVPIYAKGRNKRDWLYVTDHCDALELILAKGEDGNIYTVSADAERENIAVAKDILLLLKKSESLLTFVADRPGHDWRYALDSSAIRAMGWKPRVTFKEGLKKTVEWYQGK